MPLDISQGKPWEELVAWAPKTLLAETKFKIQVLKDQEHPYTLNGSSVCLKQTFGEIRL
jgi:hypothetical protein